MVRMLATFLRRWVFCVLPLFFTACIPELPGFIEGKKVALDADLSLPVHEIDFLTQSVRSRTYRMIRLEKAGNLKNASEVRVVQIPEGFGFRGGAYPGTNGTCGEIISEHCTVELSFEPQQNIAYGGQLILSYQGRREEKRLEISLKGKGSDNASLRFSLDGFDPIEGDLDFGSLPWSLSGERTVHILYFGVFEASGVALETPGAPFSVVSNNCPSNISADCALVIRYSGTTEGVSEDQLRMTYNNGAFPAQSQVPIKGFTTDRVTPAGLEVSGGGWGRQLINNGYVSRTFSLSRTAGSGVSATSVRPRAFSHSAFRFKGGSYPGDGGSCGDFVAGDCTVVVEFNPTSLGTKSTNLVFDYFDGIQSQTVTHAISGRGVRPAVLTLTPTGDTTNPRDFGEVSVAYRKTLRFRVTNHDDSMDATSVSFGFIDGVDFSRESGGCSGTIQENKNCEVTIKFSPQVVSSNLTDSLKVDWDDGKADQQIRYALKGIGDAKALLVLSPASHNFGQILNTKTVDKTLNIFHYGTLPATGVSVSLDNGAPFSFDGGGFPGTGDCGASTIDETGNDRKCSYSIRFSPTQDILSLDKMRLNYQDGEGGNHTILLDLRGHGGIPADLEINPQITVDLGSTPTGLPSATQTLTVKNKAGTDAKATGLVFGFPPGIVRDGGTCSTSLNKNGATCTVKVKLAAISSGNYSGNVTVTYNDGLVGGQSASRPVSGTVTPEAVLRFSQSTFNFGDVVVGKSEPRILNVSKYGDFSATLQPASPTLPAKFTYVGGGFPGLNGTCANPITGDCLIEVEHTPTNNSSTTSPYSVAYNDGSAVVTASTELKGRGRNPASLSFSQGGSYAFASTTVNDTRDFTFTVNRSGDVAATSLSLTGLVPPFSRVGGNCGTSLSNGSCTIRIRFSPKSATDGTTPVVVSLDYQTGVGPASSTINLTGSAFDAAVLTLAGNDFTDVAAFSGTNREVTVTNEGTATATAVSPTPLLAPFSFYQATTCGSTIAPGASCKLFVRYQSTRPEANSVSLQLNYHDSQTNRSATHTLNSRATVPPQVATNGEHTCAITDIGQIKCWGGNDFGQLGLGDTRKRGDEGGEMGSNLPPLSLDPDRYAVKIAAGFWHSCAILDNNALICWGGNSKGQLGAGSSQSALGDEAGEFAALTPVNLGTGLHAVDLGLGNEHSCAVLNNGQVKCWGLNLVGQLGLGDKISRGRSPSDMGNNLPALALGEDAVEVVSNTGHSCARLASGDIKCWGFNNFAQLGTGDGQEYYGDTEPLTSLEAIDLGDNRTALSLSAGGGFTCAVLDNHAVKCWGYNDEVGNLGRHYCQNNLGQTGLCSDPAYPEPLPKWGYLPSQLGDGLEAVALPGSPEKVWSGTLHTCVQLQDKTLRCWGDNKYGQLGLGDADARGADAGDMGASLPAPAIPPGYEVTGVSSGHDSVCVSASQGSSHQLFCWGSNKSGNLGTGNLNPVGDEPGEMGASLPAVAL